MFPLVLLAVVVRLAWLPIEEPDLWFHMAHARYLLEHHAFPPGDIFSFTAEGREWISTGWLGGMVFYLLWETAGGGHDASAVTLFIVCAAAAAYLTIYFAAARRRVELAAVPLLCAGMVLGCLRFNARPDLFSQLLLPIVLLILLSTEDLLLRPRNESRQTRNALFAAAPNDRSALLWALPPLMILWANLHAGFLVGVLVIGIHAAHRLLRWYYERDSRDLRGLLPCGLACAAWLANPYGAAPLALPARIAVLPGVRDMLFEWMPFYKPGLVPMPATTYAAFAALIALCILVAVLRDTRLPLWHAAIAVLLVWMTWTARRQAALAAVALPVLALPHLGALQHLLQRRAAAAIAITFASCAAAFLLGANLLGAKGLPRTGLSTDMVPVETTAFLRDNPPPPNLFNSFHFGAYLLYHLGPETKVFIDGRIDMYDVKTWNDDRAIEAGLIPLDDAIREYGLNTFVMDFRPGYDPGGLTRRLDARADFVCVFRDAISAVYVRRAPETEEYLRRLAPAAP